MCLPKDTVSYARYAGVDGLDWLPFVGNDR